MRRTRIGAATVALVAVVVVVSVACTNPVGSSGGNSGSSGSSGGDPPVDTWSGEGPFGYFAGFHHDGVRKVPVYWTATTEDGGAITISDPVGLCSVVTSPCHGAIGEATDIFVDAEDVVHVVGWFTRDGAQAAAYWVVDDDEVVLYGLDNTRSGSATGIAMDLSGIVYISGYYKTAGPDPVDIAAYWTVNAGIIDDVSDLRDTSDPVTHDSRATGIAVDGSGVVYASGYYDNGAHDVAAYWRDSGGSVSRVDLYPSALSQANAITVDGTTVYVAGRYLDGLIRAAIWMNDEDGLQQLSSQTSNVKAVTRSNGQTYVSGDYRPVPAEPRRVAAYWLGATQTDLEQDAPTDSTFANGIAVAGGDIYIAGARDSGTKRAVYWKNESIVELSTDAESQAKALFIRQ